MSVQDEVAQADIGFDRAPVAAIYEAYKQYVAAGNYPYIENAAEYAMTLYDIGQEFAGKVRHEVYLCSQQARTDAAAARAKDMESKGYFRARGTADGGANIAESKVYLLARYSDGMFDTGLHADEKVRCKIDASGRYFLMPIRNRRKEYVLGVDREYWVKESA